MTAVQHRDHAHRAHPGFALAVGWAIITPLAVCAGAHVLQLDETSSVLLLGTALMPWLCLPALAALLIALRWGHPLMAVVAAGRRTWTYLYSRSRWSTACRWSRVVRRRCPWWRGSGINYSATCVCTSDVRAFLSRSFCEMIDERSSMRNSA